MQFTSHVRRGPRKGQPLSEHRYADGTYVVSPTRFEKDQVHVRLIDIEGYLSRGWGLRMSGPHARGPRLISAGRIQRVRGDLSGAPQ